MPKQSKEEMKFCVDCKWFRYGIKRDDDGFVFEDDFRCARPIEIYTAWDAPDGKAYFLVHGKIKKEPCMEHPEICRTQEDDPDYCGPEGKFWEPK